MHPSPARPIPVSSAAARAVSMAAAASWGILFLGPIPAQDILHYTFSQGSGAVVQNMAPNGPPVAAMKNNGNASSWAEGKRNRSGAAGFALSGSDDGSFRKFNWLDTGWHGGIQGDMTIAWFMRSRSAPAIPGFPHYIASGLKGSGSQGFRIYHHGNAFLGLALKEWGGGDLILGSGTSGQSGPGAVDIPSMTRDNWLHIAIVFDTTAQTATWFLNAMPVKTHNIGNTPVGIPLDTVSMTVGKHTSTIRTSCFDIDEFRLSNRAVRQAELAAWAGTTLYAMDAGNPAAGLFHVSAASGGKLDLRVDAGVGHAGKSYLIAGGFSRTVPGLILNGVHIPLNWDPWSDITLSAPPPTFLNFQGTLDAAGRATATLDVPANIPASGVGAVLNHAALVYHPITGRFALGTNSNPLVIFP